MLPGLLVLLCVSPAMGQESYDAREGLQPKVIERADGERRFLPDGTVMRLKVGPENSGASYLFMGYDELPPGTWISARNVGRDTARVFFVFPRATVERCFQRIGRGEGEPGGPETSEQMAEERSWCRMSY